MQMETNVSYTRKKYEEIITRFENAAVADKQYVARDISNELEILNDEQKLDYYELTSSEQKMLFNLRFNPMEYAEDAQLDNTPRMHMEFIFPYHLVEAGSKVAIYGAGNVGRQIYRQAVRDKYVTIVGIVDRDAAGAEIDGKGILPVQELRRMEFDSVIISVRAKEVADQIKTSLLNMGIPAEKILWDGTTYFRDDYYKNYYLPVMKQLAGNTANASEMIKKYDDNIEKAAYDHVFPYHLFREGEKVLIYGAGDIGTKFYKQAKKDGFVTIAGIVDKNWERVNSKAMPVKSVEFVTEVEYDSLLITVHNEEIAKEITTDLVKLGVDRDRIKWDGKTYHRGEFISNVYLNIIRAMGGSFANYTQMLGAFCKEFPQDNVIYTDNATGEEIQKEIETEEEEAVSEEIETKEAAEVEE